MECQEAPQEKVTFVLITGVSQREPRFYQAEKTAYVDAVRRKELGQFEEVKGLVQLGQVN